jgi:hypothetical protein
MKKMKSNITVGITIFVNKDGELGLYENGLRQNVIFLHELFRGIKGYKSYLLNHGDGVLSEDVSKYGFSASDIVLTSDVEDELDYIICIGAAIDVEAMVRLRKKGIKLICYKGGNGGIISMEGVASKPIRGDAERYFDVGLYDAIWMTPQHLHTYKGWCEIVYRCPVYEVPQLWSPTFIQSRPKEILDNYPYLPGKKSKRISILDPNITVMKTSHMPIMVSEVAYRESPELFESLLVTNAIQLSSDPHFSSFCNALTIFQNKIASVEARYAGPDFIANHTDVVVTHHWENGLNYLYYEALYGGYPLIHNSKFIMDYGYYYPSFDAHKGGEALIKALKAHDANLKNYQKKSKNLLDQRHPTSKISVNSHLTLLRALS